LITVLLTRHQPFFMDPSPHAEPDRPVSIQVGGRTFATRLSTLRRYPEALLWRAYSFNEKSFDLVFWDRNPAIFETLLEYYRTGRLAFPPDVDFSALKEELLFWGFDVAPSERPPWPVLPPQQEVPVLPGGIRCPLGVAWREASSGCYYVLACLMWSALGRCSSLWEIAQKGHRSVTIYWKTRAPGMDFSLLKSHFRILKRLAEMDSCKVSLLPEVSTAMLAADVRHHDLYTNGHIHADPVSSHVATWKFMASYRKEGHELLIQAASPQTFAFDHNGFRVELRVSDGNLWWYMSPLQADDAPENPNVDVSMLDNAQGFLLNISFVIDRTLFPGFSLPSCYYRTAPLRADVFLGQSFLNVPEDDPLWYKAPGRHKLICETCPFDFLEREAYTEDVELVVLIEEKRGASLVCHPATNIVPYASAGSFSAASYDRVLIEW
jgi:hypothetical protein